MGREAGGKEGLREWRGLKKGRAIGKEVSRGKGSEPKETED